MCNDCQECHDLSAHTQRAQWVWKVWKGTCQEVSEAHTNAPHFHVCTLSAKLAYKLRTVSQPAVMSVATQNSELLVATLLSLHLPSEAAGTSAAAHVFPHAGFAKTFPYFFFFFARPSCWLISANTPSALTEEDTHWRNVTFNVHSHQSHAYIQHPPTQGAVLRVKRQDTDGSHLVCADGLLWWLRTGYAHTHRWLHAESGQEMDVLTIDLLRSMIHNLVIGQWGSCSHRAGTLAWHMGQTSPHPCGVHKLGKFQTKLFFPILFLGVQSLRIHDKCHKHCQTFFCCSFIISVIIYIFAFYFTVTTDSLLDCCFIFIAFSFCVLQKTNQHRSIQYECGVFLCWTMK